jgi:thiol-disulfide isomerase/thioredoxin
MNTKRMIFVLCSMTISIMLFGTGCFAETKASRANVKEKSSSLEGGGNKKPANAKSYTVVLFWTNGCSSCAAQKAFIREVAPHFPSMKVKDYEVWDNRQNSQLMSRVAKAYNLKLAGVPVTFIDKKGYTGFSDSNQQLLLAEMERCSVEDCADPLDVLAASEGNADHLSKRAVAIDGVCSESRGSEPCK